MDNTDPTPARPILASSLLPSTAQQSRRYRAGCRNEPATAGQRWDLNHGCETLLRCGQVVGLSSSMPASGPRTDPRHGEFLDIRNSVHKASLHMLVNFLLKGSRIITDRPKAFVIQFYDSCQISYGSLYNLILKKACNHIPPETIETMINNVKSYFAFDFADMLQAIHQVSETLLDLQQQNQGVQEPPHLSATDIHTTKSQNETPRIDQEEEPILLVLEGVDQALREVIQASNVAAAASQLVPLLRTLTLLSRTYKSFLTVMVVNSIPLRPSNGTVANPAPYDPHIPIQSIFSPTPSWLDCLVTSDHLEATLAASRPPFAFVLGRTLDQGFDLHLLVSKVQGEMVLEVAKDRVGEDLGRWCRI